MEEFIKYETALIAKEKGFNISQPTFYDRTGDFHKSAVAGYDFTSSEHNVVAPTQAVLHRWLREEQNINIEVYSNDGYWEACLYRIDSGKIGEEIQYEDTYEKALEAGLIKALKFID